MPKRRHGRAMSDAIPVPADSAKRKQRPAAGGCGSTDLTGRHPTDLSDGASRPSGGMQRFPSRRRTPFRRGGSGGIIPPDGAWGDAPYAFHQPSAGGLPRRNDASYAFPPKPGGCSPLTPLSALRSAYAFPQKPGGDSPPAGLGRRLIAPACPFSSTERRPSAFSAKAPPKHGASTALNLMRSRLIRLRSTRSERGRPRLRRRSAVRAGRPR